MSTQDRRSGRGVAFLERARAWLPRLVRTALREASSRDDTLLFAGSLAFYALVSMVPLSIMVLWVASLFLGEERVRHLSEELRRVAPEALGADTLLQRVAELGTGLGVTAVLAGLWPATSYGAGLMRAFDRLSPKGGRELKGLRGRGLALVFLLPLFILGALVTSFAGSRALGTTGPGRVFGLVLALLTGFLGASAAVVAIFGLFPPEPLGWRRILRATAVTAGGVSLLSLAFVLYLTIGADFQNHYATSGMAGIVLLAVWLFLANALLLVGYKVALKG